jgi:hypothetical protein
LTEAPAKNPSIGRLTEDQRAFRIALKQFALTHPERLLGLLARVRSALVQRIKDAGDKDYSWALHQAMHSGWSNSGQSLLRIKELAGIESELIDIDGLANALRVFFGDYEWDQKGIANLNMITKIDDLRTLSETQKWLSADKDCLLELIKLKVWPDGSSLKKISEDKMATPGINWTRPYRVNF